MNNPFDNRVTPLNGPTPDLAPITPDDSTDLPKMALALYVENGGTVSFTSAAGLNRSITVTNFAILPVGISRVHATGTSASGLHAFVL